jgi:regulator of nonsense transcripts 1
VLVCAASNVAVDNVILALLELQERGGGGERGAGDRDGGDDIDGDGDGDASPSFESRRRLHHLRRQPPPLRIVRLGPPAKASPAVRHLSLAALAAATPAGKAAAAARAAAASQPPGALGRASRERAAQLEEEARRQVLARAHVVAATTVAAGDEEAFGGGRGKGADAETTPPFFPFVAVDEATQATEPSSLIPLILRRATSALLVGDPRQLPPTVISREAAAAGLGASLFERLSRGGEGADFGERGDDEPAASLSSPSSSPSSSIRPFLLDTQYRMHPALAEFPSGRWYASLLRDGVGEAQRRPPRGVEWPLDLRRRRGRGGPPPPGSSSSSPALLPVLFVPCDSPEQRCGFGGGNIGSGSGSGSGGDDAASASPLRTGTTFRNDGEAAAVLSALSSLLAAGDVPPSEIGIITPYAGQARALRAALGDAAGDAIEVRTVDGFQGREKSVVLFSAVRSNSRGSVGFLADGRRLNVALTRAKRGLIVVGNPETLRADGDWREWLKWWREASGGGGG